MSATMATASTVSCARTAAVTASQRPATTRAAGLGQQRLLRCQPLSRKFLGAARPSQSRDTKAQAMEVAQVAGEFAEIGGAAAVVFATTLVGLAVGFVLLRVESLVEEGKLDDVLK